MRIGDTAARGAARLCGFEFLPVGYTAAYIVDDGFKGRAHRNFYKPDVVYFTAERKDLGALALLRADAREPGIAVIDNGRNIRPGFYVV